MSALDVLDHIRAWEDYTFGEEVIEVGQRVFPGMTSVRVEHIWRPSERRPRWRWAVLEMRCADFGDDRVTGVTLSMPRSFTIRDWQCALVRLAREAAR